MTSLLEQNARLEALETVVRQLMIQHFRNGPAKLMDEGLEDWKQIAASVLTEEGRTDAATYARAFYETLVPQIKHARTKN